MNIPLTTKALVFPLIAGWFLISCGGDEFEEDLNFDAALEDVEVETARNVEVLYSDSAIVKVRIQAPTMLNHTQKANPYQEFPDGVHVDFYQDGEPNSVLTAKYGVRYEAKGLVIVRDSVVWRNIEGKQLETNEMIWEEKVREIYNNKFVVITTPTDTIYSYGFRADQDFTNFRLQAADGSMKVEQ